ncbi:MAG: hypothetical protein JO227_15535 [Acetobacteraceae bacterium]|nr:hypothetical protein [Acetobacteraceae bacterium]
MARQAPLPGAGFTLLEALVVLVVAGLLVLGLFQGTRFGIAASNHQFRIVEQHQDLDAIDRTLRHLIEHVAPSSEWETLTFTGSARAVAFTTELPFPGSRADVELDVDSSGRLTLISRPHLHAIRIGRPPPPVATELVRGVQRLELAYWPGPGGGWSAGWNGPLPPQLVRIRIVFSGAHRQWPDILAAPALGRP